MKPPAWPDPDPELEAMGNAIAEAAANRPPPPRRPARPTCAACGSARLTAFGECLGCDARKRALARWESTVPVRYRWCSFDAPELAVRVQDPHAIARVREIGATFERIVLRGPAGVGKTSLASALLRVAASAGTSVCFVEARSLAVARAQYGLGEGEPPIVAAAMNEAVVLIDDLGAEVNALQSPVADVVHARHAQMMPTIVTTGFGSAKLLERYGDAVLRRLLEGALVIDVKPRGSR